MIDCLAYVLAEPSIEPCSADRLIHKRPSDLELTRSKLLFDPLPSIVEESLSYGPGPSSPHHIRSSSADSRLLFQETSPLSSLDSQPRDKSRTASLDSRTCEGARAVSVESRTCEGARPGSVESRTCEGGARAGSVESREVMSLPLLEVADSVGSGRSLNLRCDLESFRHPSNSNSECKH